MQAMQSIDLTGASYSAALMGLIGTAAFLFLGTGWVKRGWKVPVALCAVAALIGVVGLYEARTAWLAGGVVPIVYHYVDWVISMPVLVIALYFYARQVGTLSIALFWRLVVTSVLMVVIRYGGEAGFVHATLAFLIGIIFWLYILGELYFGQMDEAISKAGIGPIKRGYFWLRLIVTIGWAIYPLGNFIVSFNGVTDTGAISTTYNLAEFVNRIAFGLTVLATIVATSQEERSNA